MRTFYRYLWLPFYRLWALRQIGQEQVFACAGLKLSVPPGVFHPGIFFSSPIFISFLQKAALQNKKVLDIGTGSGLLALFAAQKGAIVTALDINPLAVETALRNAEANHFAIHHSTYTLINQSNNPLIHQSTSPLTFIESDLFDGLPAQTFDFILINPPYYARKPRNYEEHAFFAGENLEYFEKLFRQLPAFLDSGTCTWMILSQDCDFVKMREIAAGKGFLLHPIFEQKKWGERFFIAQADQV